MPDDWFVVAVRAVEAAATDVHTAVDDVVDMLRRAGAEHSEGTPVHAVVAALVDRGGRRLDSRPRSPTTASRRL